MYELNAAGELQLTLEAQGWLKDGKIRAVYQDITDYNNASIVVDRMFMGFEACDPEVARILQERMHQQLKGVKTLRPGMVFGKKTETAKWTNGSLSWVPDPVDDDLLDEPIIVWK